MKTLTVIKSALCLSILAVSNAAWANPYDYKVVEVTDGDTIKVEAPWSPPELGNTIALRVLGIDTPEKGGRAKCQAEADLGAKATKFAKDTIKPGQIIQVNLVGWDKFGGRIDAEVFINGKSFAEMQIAAGLARKYMGEAKASWCGK
jgi:endonuclease YncB( thermonuclease family)